ncbi:MAG TPA: pyridoxamine 5'-phosphate oxidase family protein [Lacibacter sp.]|nr:pyridoxamine 5'-phosphate oxidase family protein [Lacibacter sp.]
MEDIFLSQNLSEINEAIWKMLEQATKSHRAPFHYGTIATIHHLIPELRTVILRRVMPATYQLFFHTDIRSQKIEQIKENPLVSWLFYDEKSKMQLRLYAKAVIHTKDVVADYGWGLSRLASKLTYTTSSPSGTELDAPELINLNIKEADKALLETARNHFCVVETIVNKMDWVFLHVSGNRRAIFDYENGFKSWVQV